METLAFVLILIIFGYFSYPIILWFGFIGIYSLVYFDTNILYWIIFAILAVLFTIPKNRINLISSPLIKLITKNNLLPKISETEEAALQAGTNWIESDFFNAEINFERIKNEKVTLLTQEEQAFLDNEVNELCSMTSDWEIFQDRDLRPDVWKFIKDKRFFGMIIPKEFGGLGFTATAHSHIIEKLVSRSQVLAITIMVPNSLGPAELIIKYGTQLQKDKYLADLAQGIQVPCFGLTEPNAGSDATSITSNGVIFKDEDGKIRIKLNFEKRYITLGNVATLIGIAFQLYDPEQILGEKKNLGITFGLLDSKLKGIDNSRRHDPLGIPFVNSPLFGKDVVIELDDIIGGLHGIGLGWKMLVDSLSIGRGISLPSVSLGGTKFALKVVSSYSQIREQFGLSIDSFEGVEEKIAKIAAFSYMLNASRNYTLDAIDNGVRPGVINSVMKYHATEKFREVINNSMDVLGGSAIIRGEKNLLAHAYFALPISITVEGANILTRNLMQFGQGLIKSHPFIYKEITALKNNDVKAFDKAFFSHIGLVTKSLAKSITFYFTRAIFVKTEGNFRRYKQKLVWSSAEFTLLCNIALALLGPALKKRENISARFGDILSYMYLATATLREFDINPKEEHKPLVDYVCNYAFEQIQMAKEDILHNLPVLKIFLPLVRLNPIGIKTKDKLNQKIVTNLKDVSYLQDLTSSVFVSTDNKDRLNILEKAIELNNETKPSFIKIKIAIKRGDIKKDIIENMFEEALEKNIITKDELAKLKRAHKIKQTVIEVDSYKARTYKSMR
jgi:acyl-CoA dehydrogenase